MTTIASGRVAAWTSRTARAILIGLASDPDLTSTCSSQARRSDVISSPYSEVGSPGPSAASRSTSQARASPTSGTLTG